MTIVHLLWHLLNPLPAAFFDRFAKLAVGNKQPMCSTKRQFIGSKKQHPLDLEWLKFLTFE